MTTTVFLSSAAGADRPLADAFARALPRFGRRGAVRVVRDGDPGATDWFLLLASPEAAQDPAVGTALERRLAAVGVERMQVVVTAGSWAWDTRSGALAVDSSAAPEVLRRAFPAEPRHMPYRGDRGAAPSPRDPLFLEQVAEIVAPVLGTTKDDLAGEDVRRQRRTRRLARSGASVLALLLVVAGVAGVVAAQGAAVAQEARDEAQQRRDDADSRRLAALAGQVASTDGSLGRLLAVEAWRISPTEQAREAVAQAALVTDGWDVTTSDEVTRLIGHASYPVALALSGTHVASIDVASALRIWPLADAASPARTDSIHGLADLAWSHDGEALAAAGGRVHLFDVDGGALGFAGPRSPAHLVGPWGGSGFVAGGGSVALIQERAVVVERPVGELGFTARTAFVQGSRDGTRVLAASDAGEVVVLDEDLEVVSRWRLTLAVDQFGERDSLRALAWDGADRVVLPPDNAAILGPVLGADGAPDPQDGAIAGVYDVRTGAAIEPLRSDGYMPLPASAAAFLPDGAAIAVTPGGLESAPALGGTGGAPDLSSVPLPERAELVRVSPDGAWLAVAGHGAEAHLVRIGAPTAREADDPVARACAAAGRNLTPAEWGIYLSGRDYRATCESFAAP